MQDVSYGEIDDLCAALSAPAPCDGCQWTARCAKGEACVAFKVFVDSPRRWQMAPRQPSAAAYRRLFPESLRRAA